MNNYFLLYILELLSYLCFKNGGSAFVIAFVVLLFVIGLKLIKKGTLVIYFNHGSLGKIVSLVHKFKEKNTQYRLQLFLFTISMSQ